MYNGYASLLILVERFDDYKERYGDWENEFVEELLDYYKKFGYLSEKQTKLLAEIANQISLSPETFD